MYGVFDISTSALVAHRTHLDVIAGNIAMRDAMSFDASGEPTPAKGNTLLNYCHVDRDLLGYITEKALVKIGLFTPGTQIPVVNDAQLMKDQPDYAMIMAWNFAKEIMGNLQAYKDKGGKFIIPIPEFKVLPR